MRVIMSKRKMARLVSSDVRWLGRLTSIAVTVMALLSAYPAAARDRFSGDSGRAYEAIVLDAQTGQVLRELNADTTTQPASLTKMMTLYLTFEALNQGRLRLDQYLPPPEQDYRPRKGRIGFALVEFQICDEETATANETGENSHENYKQRQKRQVLQRLARGLVVPRRRKNGN